MKIRERAIGFGEAADLSGILTEPGKGEATSTTGVVILNSGILHRVGASRIYVQLARALAEKGFPSLRFDFSGIGDSGARKDNLPFETSSPLEAREAMDYLSKRKGVDAFILIGLCSGADMAYQTALADDRVAALAQLDGFVYRNWRYHAKRVGNKVLSPSGWAHSVRVRLAPDAEAELRDDSIYDNPEYRRLFPPKEEVEAGLQELMERKVHLFHFFSGDQPEHVNHQAQYGEAFGKVDFCDRLRVMYDPEADHTVTGLKHQKVVVKGMAEWAAEVFPLHATVVATVPATVPA